MYQYLLSGLVKTNNNYLSNMMSMFTILKQPQSRRAFTFHSTKNMLIYCRLVCNKLSLLFNINLLFDYSLLVDKHV